MIRLVALAAVFCLALAGWCERVLAQSNADPATSGPSLEVSLLTIGPGDIYWQRFGHNAIVIHDPASGESVSYNYGMFDFDEANFFVNFLRGHMTYQITAEDPAEEIAWYSSEGRSITRQDLRLSPTQAEALKTYLEDNLLPENRHYRYDYFTSNCSTRVRDALDKALGGALQRQMTSPSRGFSFRLLADALTAPQPLLMAVIDIGLGPYADQRLSYWKDSFVPMQLRDHLREMQVADAQGELQPLVKSEQVVAAARLPAPPALPPDLRWPFFAIGVALAALLLMLRSRPQSAPARRGFAVFAFTFSLVCGLIGLVLLGLWGFTEHQSAWRNENLLIFSPLCLLMLGSWWRSARPGSKVSAFARGIAAAIALLAAFALFSKILANFPQANLHWILLLLPIHLVLARSAAARRD
ncbi:MAG: DUF4105 domain-containing protein [Xanthomonadales bacterium]|nr:DUF4105 domain-containing protein [Xanthomonadales bacterium]